MQTMADRVALVVVAVRNLLYVSGTLTGSLPNLGGTALSHGHGIHHKGAGASGLNGVGLNGIGAGLAEDADWVRQEIKPYQRKVTATLSKLVLSARAVNANPDWPVGGGRAGSSGRVESDAAELERAVTNFVYQIQRTAASSRAKRLQGVMLPGDGSAGIGVGLIGGGVGGNWKGAGFVPVGDSALGAPAGGPEIRLGREVVSELAGLKVATEEKMSALRTAVEEYKSALAVVTGEITSAGTYDSRAADLVILNGRLVVAQITDFLLHAEDVDISMGVDVMGTEDDDEAYLAGVKRARELIRTFETAKQALYDDGSVLLMASQAIHVSTLGTSTLTNATPTAKTGGPADVLLQTAIPAIQSNLGTLMETLELLLDIAHDQAVVQAQRDPPIGYQDDVQYQYNGERQQGQYQRDPMYPDGAPYSGDVNEMLEKMGIRGTRGDATDETDMVDIGDALAPRGESRPPTGQRHAYVKGDPGPGARDSIDGGPAPSEITLIPGSSNGTGRAPSSIAPSLGGESTTVASNGSTTGPMDDDSDYDDFDKPSKSSITWLPLGLDDANVVSERKPGTSKLEKILGREAPVIHTEQQKQLPAYLRLDHASSAELITNPDGAVRAGTLPALIERLTMHSGTGVSFSFLAHSRTHFQCRREIHRHVHDDIQEFCYD
jgi:son of sevenless-like protein